MKRLAFVVSVVCAACVGDPGTDFPIQPGAGSATSGTSIPGDDSGAMLRGRVCVVEDIRFQNVCATTGVRDVTVTLGGVTVTTSEDGTFAMTPPVGTNLSFTAGGPGIVTTSQALNARAQINALRQDAFDDMLLATGVTPVAGTGSIIALVSRGGVGLSGVSATSNPASAFGPFFDGVDPMPWVTNATGVRGIVWFPGLVAGPADLSFNTLTGGQAIVGGVQVINGGITMVETPLP